ncbi:hypothetical protein DRH14_03940 [Candidatus Shapirobacteria bacterium]|nr:MAG: hypothetical protein DRH14_03940 [Candidatus Shapirobacteria bacterium]
MATKIYMPRLGESIEEATIGRWCKQVGGIVARGDVIAELETAKAMMELESPVNGVLLAVLPEVGETIHRGDLVAVVGKAGEDWEAEIREKSADDSANKTEKDTQRKAESIHKKDKAGADRISIAPNAKRIAKEKGVDLKELAALFPNKRITSGDIEKYLKKTGTGVPVRKVVFTNIQKITAKRMAESAREIPQFSVSADIRADKLYQSVRESEERGKKVSLTAAIIFHTASALSKYPALNAFFENGTVFRYEEINIGVAVATEQGLYVPVIHHADMLALEEVADKLADLSEKARKDTLSVEEVFGGTFTLSSLGMKGIRSFNALVNPSQAAILAVGTVRQEISLDENDTPVRNNMITLTLSADHRAVGGYECAEFFEILRKEME